MNGYVISCNGTRCICGVVTRIYQRIHMPFNVSRTKFAGIQIFRMLDPNISLSPKCTFAQANTVCARVCLCADEVDVPNSPQSCDWFDFDCMQEKGKGDTSRVGEGKEFVCRLSGGIEIAMKSTRTWLCTLMRTRFGKVIRLWVALPYNLRSDVLARAWVCGWKCIYLAVAFSTFF